MKSPFVKAGAKKRKRSTDDSSDDSDSSASSEDETEKVWSCKELEHNLTTLIGHAKNEILKSEREKREQEDRKHNYSYEQVDLLSDS